jgi:hypothetical protein
LAAIGRSPTTNMAQQGNRKIKPGLAKRERNNKALFLPLNVSAANQILLRSWTAFERARSGEADAATATALAHAVAVAARVAEAGFGTLDEKTLRIARDGLAHTIEQGCQTGEWKFGDELLESLGIALDEHHRQLRQVRMAAIVDANEWLEGRLDRGERLQDILRVPSRGQGK